MGYRGCVESLYFCHLGAHAKFQNPKFLLSGQKVRASVERGEKERGGEIMPLIMTTTLAQLQGSARTPLGQ